MLEIVDVKKRGPNNAREAWGRAPQFTCPLVSGKTSVVTVGARSSLG